MSGNARQRRKLRRARERAGLSAHVLRLSARDWDRLMEILADDSPPAPELMAAGKRYMDAIASGRLKVNS